MPDKAKGRCLCGAVSYSVDGPLDPITACHCTNCARSSGHHAAFTACHPDALTIADNGGLQWFRSSPEVERGFCSTCGSNLFWRETPLQRINITAGTMDRPTGLTIGLHIHTASKSDYYDVTDIAPQKTSE